MACYMVCTKTLHIIPSITSVPAKTLSQAPLARGVDLADRSTQVDSALQFLMTAARPSRHLHWIRVLSPEPTLYLRRSAWRVHKRIFLFAQSSCVYSFKRITTAILWLLFVCNCHSICVELGIRRLSRVHSTSLHFTSTSPTTRLLAPNPSFGFAFRS